MRAVWQRNISSPFHRPNSPYESYLWQFNPDDEERIAAFFARLLPFADHLRFLADRQNLISVVRDPATRAPDLHQTRERTLALLLVDEGQSPELEENLRALESKDPDDSVASWVRARLAAR